MTDMTNNTGVAIPPREQVASYLRRQMKDGRLSKGEEIPSRRVLAKKFGVSSRTVSNALRLLTASGLVRHVPGKGVFVSGARSEQKQKILHTLGVIGSYASQAKVGEQMSRGVGYSQGVLNALARYAYDAHMAVLLIPATDKEPLNLDLILESHPDCLITLGIEMRPETVIALRRRGIPCLLGNRHLEHIGVSYVDFNTEDDFVRAVDIFCEHGHRCIACITSPSLVTPIARQCRRAFFAALAERGLGYVYRDYYRLIELDHPQYSPKLIAQHRDEARRLCLEMLDYPDPPTAFYTHNRTFSEGIVDAVRERGLVLGRDISLLACSYVGDPEPISYFLELHDELGRKMVKAAQTIIRDPFAVCQVNVPNEFVDKGSIATLGQEKEVVRN